MSRPQPLDDMRAVEAANTELYEAFEAGDLDRMERLWAAGELADSVVCVHPGAEPIQGRVEVLRSWALLMANTSYIQFFLTDVEVTVFDGVAVVTCNENILTADDSEGELTGGKGTATNVFRRQADGWQLWLHHSSPVMTYEEGEEPT